MTVSKHLSVVIPAFNEARRIERTIAEVCEALPSFSPDWEVRVVDDGSQDQTARLVANIAAIDSRVVLQQEPHRGKGGAVRHGLLEAAGELRFMCDADLSMPIREIGRFLAVVPSECDIAIGTREGAGADRVGEPEYRHVMGRMFNTLVQAAVLSGLNDTQCGFKMLTARAVESIFPRMTIDGWAFDIEMLYIARRQGVRIREVPIPWHYRDQSQVSAVRDSLRMARDVMRIRANGRRRLYDQGPR